MSDHRDTADVRLQRLANLSIEIRMLKARVQATLEDQPAESGDSTEEEMRPRGAVNGARCPHCGHTAGLALLPREYRRLSTLVRCFACRRDSAAFDWALASPRPDAGNAARSRGTGFGG